MTDVVTTTVVAPARTVVQVQTAGVAAVTRQTSVTVTPSDRTVTARPRPQAPATLSVTPTSASVAVPSCRQGPPGPQGIPGVAGGSVIQVEAGEALSGHRVVRVDQGLALYCDGGTVAHAGTALGITTGAAAQGDLVTVQTLGDLSEASWSFAPGPVFVGATGALSQTPGAAFVQPIAVATSATTININPLSAIIRS